MTTPICWVISDGKAGLENPCVAIARRLGLEPVIKRVKLRSPWKQLSPWALRYGNRWALSPEGDQLDAPLPDLVIATGRASVAPALALKDLTGGRCLRVQLQTPGVDPRHFDLVAVPAHDRLRGPNVMVTRGSPHGVTPALLDQARVHFLERLGGLPSPRIAVMIGGSNSAYRFTRLAAESLADCLSTLVRGQNGALMMTMSRRTDPEISALLTEKLSGLPGEIWDGTGENPYFGYLAYADHILVTADSVNMTCEAARTGKPVQTIPLDGGSAKFRRFHDGLQVDGITRPFLGRLEHWHYAPFDDTDAVAERVRALLRERGL